MKKIFALVLCLMMAFTCTAVAEETGVLVAEALFDGVWVQFEEGFEFYIPSDWYEITDVPQELIDMGFCYAACTEDMAYNLTLEWHPLSETDTLETVLESALATFDVAEIVEVNGVQMVTYVNPENDQRIFVALDAAEPGMYCFVFTPASDPDFQVLAALIASTIRNIPA